ncbi:MAG: carbohydrate kinase family protein [Thermoproteales archaeon]|nr:carbohydrate kinase family protein [Thermoproteales archaeon]
MKILDFGILVVDLIAAGLPNIADPGQVVFTPRGIKTRIGGHAANFSIDEVKLGLEGKNIIVIGAVGDDVFGRFIEDTLSSYGLDVRLEKNEGVDTSKNLILVVKGEDRRFHVDIGANIMLSVKHITDVIKTEKPDIIYVGATGWLGEVDDNLKDILEKGSENAITFVDPIAPYRKNWSYILPAFEHIHIFHCNNIEANMITSKEDIEESAIEILKKGVQMVLITLGEKGLYARTDSWSIRMNAFKVDTIDPTGAGDAFSAGIIYKIIEYGIRRIEDLSLDKAVEMLIYASASGASATLKEGTTEGVDKKTVNEIIEEQKEKILASLKIEEF